MSKSLLFGIVGLLVGVAIGAATMHWADTHNADVPSVQAPPHPEQDKFATDSLDPVVRALKPLAFVNRIVGDRVESGEFKHGGGRIFTTLGKHESTDLGYKGEAVWNDEPVDDMLLRERITAAIKDAIAAGGATEAAPLKVSMRAINSHKVYRFSCPYHYSVKGGTTQLRWARVSLTAPVTGNHYSLFYGFER